MINVLSLHKADMHADGFPHVVGREGAKKKRKKGKKERVEGQEGRKKRRKKERTDKNSGSVRSLLRHRH